LVLADAWLYSHEEAVLGVAAPRPRCPSTAG
jgi:hypothetical protein